ncbi:MAG: PEP-CTERM sorting domain-containing protein [Spirulina sp. SIO3F2]|nr:PEP-CTERM sorting domain-containing protein [Spirulina sp. SIO3F2]
MQTKLFTGLVAVAAASSAVLCGIPAQAATLQSYTGAYNAALGYIQDERVPVADAADHKLENATATGDSIDIFFADKDGALALFADRILYGINGEANQLAFDGRRVDDSAQQVAVGEGFSVNTNVGDLIDFSLWTKGWWDDPSNEGFILGSDESQNVAGNQHIVAYSEVIEGEDWLFLGFEDIPALMEAGYQAGDIVNAISASELPDWDYNDAFIAVRGVTLGGDDPKPPEKEVPEPTALLSLLAIAGAGTLGLRRK